MAGGAALAGFGGWLVKKLKPRPSDESAEQPASDSTQPVKAQALAEVSNSDADAELFEAAAPVSAPSSPGQSNGTLSPQEQSLVDAWNGEGGAIVMSLKAWLRSRYYTYRWTNPAARDLYNKTS